MVCSGFHATSLPSCREPNSPPQEQQVRFWNNNQEVKPPPLSPISCNYPSGQYSGHYTTGVSKPEGTQKQQRGRFESATPVERSLRILTDRQSASSRNKELGLAEPATPRSQSSQLSGSFVSLTLGKMATLKEKLKEPEGSDRPHSPARDDALDAAVSEMSSETGKVQKQVSEIESKGKQEGEGGFLGKMFARRPSPTRLTIPNEPIPKILTRKTSPPSPGQTRPSGLPPKRALSPQPFRGPNRDVLSPGRSQSAFQQRSPEASAVRRELGLERESTRKFVTSPRRGDSASRHTKEWVNALMPPRIPSTHEPKRDSDARPPLERRSHSVALMQSAHSHRETSALLLSPTVSSSEDEDMWDMPMDTDHLSSDSAEGSEKDHLTIDRKAVRRTGGPANRQDVQKAEFMQLVQRQQSFEDKAQKARPAERRPSVEGRVESLFSRESNSFSLIPRWKKERPDGNGAHSMTLGRDSGSFSTGGKAQAGLSADALRNRQNSPGTQSFGFAFDNAQFSDRVLILEISADANYDLEGDGRDPAKVSPSSSPPLRKSIHINSAIVAVKSNFFYNLLGENQPHKPVMRIRPEDEAPVLDMLRFMYAQSLQASAPEELAQVLIVADRYGVSGCFKHTFRLLSAVPMDAQSACLFLDLPRHLKDPGQIQNLVLMARSWLVVHFRDLEKTYRTDEFLGLSLMGVRTILESDVLQISSEVTAFNALVNWSRHHFPKDEAQRAKVVAKLANLIRFPFMTTESLRQALDMPELNSDVGRGLIVEALFFKAEPFFKQNKLAETEIAHSRYQARSNDSRLAVSVQPMDESGRQASLFMELKKSQFQNLQPGSRIHSKTFLLGNQTLSVSLAKKQGRNSPNEGVLSVVIHGLAAKSKIVGEYEFFTRFHTMDPFQSLSRGKLSFKSGKEEQGQTTLKVPDDKNTMIHLRADLVIKT